MNHPAHTPAPADAWVSMRHMQRAMVFMKAQGMACDELLQQGGLTHEQLADGDRMVPLSAIEAILNAAQRRHDDPMLGLRMADDIQPATLGALGFVLQACSTLGDLVDVAVRFNGLMSNIGHTSVSHAPGVVEVRWDCRAGSALFRRHACEYILGTFAMLTRLLAPGAPGPMAVHFPHPRPESAERVRAYFDFFGCPVHFGQAHAAIITSASRLQWRLPHGDAVLKDMLERHAQHLLDKRTRTSSLPDDVRRLLQALILTGTPTKEAVAQQLGTSARSLHRRLEAENTSYGEQLDAVRLSLAREQLNVPDTPIADIAERLGFSSPQAFMRWFKQLVGATPGQYRSGLPTA